MHQQASDAQGTEAHRMAERIGAPLRASIPVDEPRDDRPEDQMIQHRSDPQQLHAPLIRGVGKTVSPSQQGYSTSSAILHMAYCPTCGAEVAPSADECPECATALRTAGGVAQHLERVAAGVLALAFGALGAHKFYLGRPVIGVLYILFIWTLLPPLIALIEGLLYLNSDDATFARRYADGSVLGLVG